MTWRIPSFMALALMVLFLSTLLTQAQTPEPLYICQPVQALYTTMQNEACGPALQEIPIRSMKVVYH